MICSTANGQPDDRFQKKTSIAWLAADDFDPKRSSVIAVNEPFPFFSSVEVLALYLLYLRWLPGAVEDRFLSPICPDVEREISIWGWKPIRFFLATWRLCPHVKRQ